jgi:hypothetical protein
VVGRSPNVLIDTVEILRGKGYSADATNQFDRVLDDYAGEDIDILVFGGMVPADTKQRLRQEISEHNAHVTFVQGLAGIAGLIAPQVEGVTKVSIASRYQPRSPPSPRSSPLPSTRPCAPSLSARCHRAS